ncbi:extracellular solute-binding protein [Amycolatopsis sp. NBC_00345]|uniref:ABC transporter substrate-binding protein n=1 Tax=Amycolatopsis sp. NBC_00345 TaxID=2975955 RepID=UPI002E262A13
MSRRRAAGLVPLVLAAVLGATTACGPAGPEVPALQVIASVNGSYPVQQKQWFAGIAAKFKQRTGANLEFDTFSSTGDVLTRMQTSVISNQGPDVFELGTTFTPTAFSTGAFTTLTDEDWAKVGGKQRFRPETLGLSGPPGREIAVPETSLPYVLVYNKDLLAKAGISRPADSWDGLLAQAKQLTRDGAYGLSVAYGDTGDTWKLVRNLTVQLGNPLVQGKTVTLDDPRTLAAYRTLYSWRSAGVVDPAAAGWNNSQALAEFAAGKSAMMLGTSGLSQHTLDSSAVAGKYAYATMPTIPPGHTTVPPGGRPATSILSGNNLVVADYSRQPGLAFAYIDLVTSEAEQEHLFDVFGTLPANAAATAKVTAGKPALKPILDSGRGSAGTPFTGAWGDVQLQLSNVTVQLIPQLARGCVSDTQITEQLRAAQKTASDAVARAR